MTPRTQTALRSTLDRYLQTGWEITSRAPITLARTGCQVRYEVRSGMVVEV